VAGVDIVLLDLEMPVMDGVETMKRMRTDHPR
jgi:CheY-like chemotaxis protein